VSEVPGEEEGATPENEPEPTGERPSTGEVLRLVVVAVVALWLALYLLPVGARMAPMALQKAISWSTFRALSQVGILGLTLGVALVLRVPRAALGVTEPRWRGALVAVLASPLVWSVAAWVALSVALPTLMEELATRGSGASRQQAGAFGRELTGTPWASAILSGALLAAAAEELVFRGALWGAVAAVVRRWWPAGRREAVAIVVATATQAAAFGWAHHDLPGGVGIVRVVSTGCLGLAAGGVRAATGSIVASGQARGVFAGGAVIGGLPVALFVAGAGGAIGAAALLWAGRPRAPQP
jgi:membrane protease YdiL (CAAX protease family)